MIEIEKAKERFLEENDVDGTMGNVNCFWNFG